MKKNKHIEVNQLNEIKSLLKIGTISYTDAKRMAAKPLAEMNEKMEKVAKRYGMKHSPITFTKVMR